MFQVRLKKGRDGPIRHGHPWVFSGAVDAVREDVAASGAGPAEADVFDAGGVWLGRGLYQPEASLVVRIFTQTPDIRIDGAFMAARIDQALAVRAALSFPNPQTNAWRLIFAEADGLSGLIVDQYADVLVVRIAAAIWLPFLGGVIDKLRQRTGCRVVQVTADRDAAVREGLTAAALRPFEQSPAPVVTIKENGFSFDVDPVSGQKTGFYLDQRDNRSRVARYAAGRRMLSVFCYSGAFEVYAAAAGVRTILGVDASEPALQRARAHLERAAPDVPAEYLRADAPVALRGLRDRGETFDLIVLDPPCFVPVAAARDKGLRAYKDINLLAMKLLAPGGILATFSCSGQLPALEFRRVLGWAARDAQRMVRILETLTQPPDHPIHPCVPETDYLKGFICRVDPL